MGSPTDSWWASVYHMFTVFLTVHDEVTPLLSEVDCGCFTSTPGYFDTLETALLGITKKDSGVSLIPFIPFIPVKSSLYRFYKNRVSSLRSCTFAKSLSLPCLP